MRYLPLSKKEEEKILKLCKVESFEELVSDIPKSLRVQGLLDLEQGYSEWELKEKIAEKGAKNKAASMKCLLGMGAYDHDWPVTIDHLISRGEFLTAYTPYQPELSQGTLQAVFEFQSMIRDLMGMEVSNASLYDGSTAVVEACLMAARLKRKKKGRFLVSESFYPQTLDVLKTYLEPLGFECEVISADPEKSIHTELIHSEKKEDVIAVLLQSPNRWGLIEDWSLLKKSALHHNALAIAHVSHAHAPILFESPGALDVDIVTGEGQSLGIPLGLGGPYLGLLCCRKKDVRQMPGRLVGATVDARNKQAFCVTLATREQHIRREKATSNICSNQNLMLIRATIYLSMMGKVGMKKKAHLMRSRSYYLRNALAEILEGNNNYSITPASSFNEFSIHFKSDALPQVKQLMQEAQSKGVLLGLLQKGPQKSNFKESLTIAVTEKHDRAFLDGVIDQVKGAHL